MENSTLKQKWEDLLKENPRLRIRNAAAKLGVSEVELLALNVSTTVTRLKNKPQAILLDLKPLQLVMGLTRNDDCVIERTGKYRNCDFKEDTPMGTIVSKTINLRIFFSHWDSAFAVEEQARGKTRKSIQFFSKDGLAVHKIYLIDESVEEEYDKVVEKYKSDNQEQGQKVVKLEEKKLETKKDEDVDIEAFHKAWKELKHVHDFYGMIIKHGLGRLQSLRLAPEEYVKKINKDSVVMLLENVAKQQIPIMVFVGNKGMIQIHSGEINKTMWHEKWFNVIDPGFNLHLNMEGVDSAWVVRRPTDFGDIISVEVYDKVGETIAQFFGTRPLKGGQSEEWYNVANNLG